MTEERWLPIAGYEGLYEVSDAGRVRSLDRLIHRCTGAVERHRGRILKQYEEKGTYLFVPLCRDGARKLAKVHRLVAAAFLVPIEGKPHVNHIDHNRQHNAACNLEWVTPKENTAAAIAAGKFAIAHAGGRTLAINNPKRRQKLTPEDVAAIRAACASGERQADIGARYGVRQCTVSSIKRGEIWNTTARIKCDHRKDAA